ncbi:MAG: FAD-dependent monooxygenase, partial [Pseudomonadota bacterium]
DHNGLPCSAVVWMETAAHARGLLELEDNAFDSAASERSAHVMGPLTLVTKRTAWPIISRLANTFYGERTALVAETAHVVPPIGAQGLNMSLKDIETLLDLCTAQRNDIGCPDMLQQYHRARYAEVRLRVTGVGVLNQISMTGAAPLRTARAWGLDALHTVTPVRKALMRLGLGAA